MRAKNKQRGSPGSLDQHVKVEVVRNCPEGCMEAEETPHSGTEVSRAEVVKAAWGVFGRVKIIA